MLQCLRVHKSEIISMDLSEKTLVSTDIEGNLILMELNLQKLEKPQLMAGDDFLQKVAGLKVSSEPIWRVLLEVEKETIICSTPNWVQVVKWRRKRKSVQMYKKKKMTSPSYTFGYAEFLSLEEIQIVKDQIESKII